MSKDLSMNMIPDQLNITIRTSVPGYQKIEYKPSMTIQNIDEKGVKFNPLIKLNKSVINRIPEEYKIKEFFNKGLFQSLLNYTGGTPAKNLIQAKRSGYIDNNIKVTLDTIFPTNSVIYIGKNPYVIGDVQWTSGDWKLEVKQKKLDIDINKIRDPRLYGELVKEEIISGEKQLNELPSELLTGNNYTGPPVVAKGVEKPEEIKKPEESTELVKYEPIQKEIVKPEIVQKRIEPSKDEEKIQKKILQIENEPNIKEQLNSQVEEITPEEEKLHDIINLDLKYSINDTKYFINYLI